MNNQKISQKTWFIILLIIVFFPIGLYLMWKNKKFNKVTRIVITALFVIFIIGNLGDKPDSQLENRDREQTVSSDNNKDLLAKNNDLHDEIKEDNETNEEINNDNTTNNIISDIENTDNINATKDENKDEVNTEKVTEKSTSSSLANIEKDTIQYKGVTYKIISVEGGDLSGDRQANVAVNIGFGDRDYWAFTNEYGQLVTVIADKIILQDDKTEPVNSNGRYYADEAKVRGTERKDLDEGHVIADSLGGVSNAYNITPQNSTLNRYGDQAYMEKVIRDAGGATDFIATISYPNSKTQIPSHYHYEYVLQGNKIIDDFDNVDPDEVNKTLSNDRPDTKATSKSNSSTDTTSTETNKETNASTDKTKDTKNNTNSKTNTKTKSITEAKSKTATKHDLSSVDTNGNGKVTIAEAKAAGYSMPIYSDHWLYQYMDDRDGDGVVGE